MLPSIFGENLFDDFFDDDFFRMPAWTGRDPLYGKRGKNLMKTDVRETDTSYELDVDLPGFKKDEINVDLQNGYLTIQASKGLDKDQKDQQGRYIRQERYAGACSRSFYVGDIQPDQVSAKYEEGQNVLNGAHQASVCRAGRPGKNRSLQRRHHHEIGTAHRHPGHSAPTGEGDGPCLGGTV